MKPDALIDLLDAEVLAGTPRQDLEIRGGYACDMLSFVVSRLKENQVWLTILNSVNVVAVASLAECPIVVLTESMTMEPDVCQRAQEKGLLVLATPLSTYEAAARLDRGLRQENEHAPR